MQVASLQALIAVMAGVFKFWDEVCWLIKLLQTTPAEKHQKIIAQIHNASLEADATKGDTSAYEKILGG